jgi:uncharacterized protein YkwD
MPWSRTARRLVPVIAAGVVLFTACGAPNPSAANDAVMVNRLRAAHAMRTLPRSLELDQKAQAQAQRMANAGTIFHSTSLTSGVSPGWQMIGENVAVASSIPTAEAALEASPPHRENLLNPYYTEMGIGAVQKGSATFVCQVFVQR